MVSRKPVCGHHYFYGKRAEFQVVMFYSSLKPQFRLQRKMELPLQLFQAYLPGGNWRNENQ